MAMVLRGVEVGCHGQGADRFVRRPCGAAVGGWVGLATRKAAWLGNNSGGFRPACRFVGKRGDGMRR